MLKLTKRLLLSIFFGLSFVLLGMAVLPRVLGTDTADTDSLRFRIVGQLLYWPSTFIRRQWFALDCPNDDIISEKLDCIGISLGVNSVAISALCFGFLSWRSRRRRLSSC